MSAVPAPYACPACLELLRDELGCPRCGRVYDRVGAVAVLLEREPDSALKRRQATYFDREENEEFEIVRPNGAPRFHRWLLGEKFRRGSAGIALSGRSALAVCAGSGMDAEFLARAGARVIASDISLGASQRAAERARRFDLDLTAIVADVERLPFQDASVDVVYVHDGLHHLEDPVTGLREMARIARSAVCVSEPAVAALTRAAVHAGIALEQEEAGNRVARLTPHGVAAVLAEAGFRVVRSERYGMFYRHEPGLPSRVLSAPGLFGLAKASFRLANALGGRFGNKLSVIAVRE